MYGQERAGDSIPPGLKKNVVYVTGGGFIAGISGAAGYYGINAERMLWNTDGFVDAIALRMGIGELSSGGGIDSNGGTQGRFLVGTINLLTGKRSAHFEMDFGMAHFHGVDEEGGDKKNFLLPAAALGYRYQAPGRPFVFRTGVAFPELFYLSFGVCF